MRRAPGFDLDKYQDVAIAGDQVDLAPERVVAACQNSEALRDAGVEPRRSPRSPKSRFHTVGTVNLMSCDRLKIVQPISSTLSVNTRRGPSRYLGIASSNRSDAGCSRRMTLDGCWNQNPHRRFWMRQSRRPWAWKDRPGPTPGPGRRRPSCATAEACRNPRNQRRPRARQIVRHTHLAEPVPPRYRRVITIPPYRTRWAVSMATRNGNVLDDSSRAEKCW